MEFITAGFLFDGDALAGELREAVESLGVHVLSEPPDAGDWDDALRRIRQARPDAVFLGVASAGARFSELVAAIRDEGRGPVVIAVDAAPDPETIIAAMRAGASEFVFRPFSEHLRHSVERVKRMTAEVNQTRSRSRVLGFLSAKGGCGASTVACHVAFGLQKATEDRILLADLDLEAGVQRFLLKTKSEYSVIDAVNSLDRLDISLWRGFVSNGVPRLEIIGAPKARSLSGVSQTYNFRDLLRFARAHYDWIVTDLGRGITPSVDAALEEIDETYIVTTLDVLALYQAQQVVHTLESAGYERFRMRAIVNRASRSAEISRADFEKSVGVPVYFALPNGDSAVSEAYLRGVVLDGRSPIGAQLRTLARKIAAVPETAEPRKRRMLFFR